MHHPVVTMINRKVKSIITQSSIKNKIPQSLPLNGQCAFPHRFVSTSVIPSFVSDEGSYHEKLGDQKNRIDNVALRNIRSVAQCDDMLNNMRNDKWKLFQPQANWKPFPVELKEKAFMFRPGLTFTPYANAVPCNAHCGFCSEDLQRLKEENNTKIVLKSNSNPTKRVKEYDQYFAALKDCLETLCTETRKYQPNFSLGLSLSGLEATAEPNWLLRLLDVISLDSIRDFFDEKVLYSNGSGFHMYPQILEAFEKVKFDRIELSRQHFDEKINQKVMRFEKSAGDIQYNNAYESLVKNHISRIFKHCKNSCILTLSGIHTIEDIENYVQWAASLGVTEVVFRELSRLNSGDDYNDNATKKWIFENRVSIEPLLLTVCPTLSSPRRNWSYLYSTIGYYYYNEHLMYNGTTEVIFETSSYTALSHSLRSGVINKLIFHSNGNLTEDWDMNSHVIANFMPQVEKKDMKLSDWARVRKQSNEKNV